MIELPLTKGFRALIDEQDWHLAEQSTWHASVRPRAKQVYAAARKDKKIIYLHRLICGAGDGQFVDHINGNTLDNRRANLRICSQEENLANTKLSAANKSGFKGVYFAKSRGLWVAQLRIEQRTVSLGGYRTAQEAARVYDKAALQTKGEFAMTNERLGLLTPA